MKRIAMMAGFATLLSTNTASAAPADAQFFGLTQLTAESGEGVGPGRGLKIGADRIRLGYKINKDKFFGKLQLELLKSNSADTTGPEASKMIYDAIFGYKYSDGLSLQMGHFVMPTTMDFQVSASKLDITKRHYDANLALNRAPAIMAFGKMGDFGYQLAAGEQAERSSAVGDHDTDGRGHSYSYAARLTFDKNTLHVEASMGVSENAETGDTGADYKVMSAGMKYVMDKMTFKLDYTMGENITGTSGYDGSVWFAHAGYMFNDKNEAVVRHYGISNEKASVSTDVGNTFLGLNHHINENALIQLNYVLASGDTDTWNGLTSGIYLANAFLSKFQFTF